MIGALIGDLAAWMWENNRQMFYSQLISSNAEPSIYGHAILKAACRNVITDPRIDVQPASTPQSIKYYGQWVMWQIVGAWIDKHDLVDIPTFHSLDKGEYYTEIFIYGLIKELRNGATKSEAFNKIYSFKSLIKSNHDNWKNAELNDDRPGHMLVYVFRAWDSFYRGFDFTSSIHNAMKWSGDKHLLAAITGAFAEAMYGCQFNLIKKKYQKGNTTLQPFELNEIAERNGYHHGLIFEMNRMSREKQIFYAKNEALTNVEIHHWQDCYNVFEEIHFTDEDYSRIIKSAPTHWECRYGFYLDDGWIYIYRSGWLISRFKMMKIETSWAITQWQLSGERCYKDSITAFESALYEGCRIENHRIHSLSFYMSECKYFDGEKETPTKWMDTIEGKFWNGEMMFLSSIHNYDEWRTLAESVRKDLQGSKKESFEKYSDGQQTILCYIETLYRKWCPYDDMNWILEY